VGCGRGVAGVVIDGVVGPEYGGGVFGLSASWPSSIKCEGDDGPASDGR
jgi:hypothetical protein